MKLYTNLTPYLEKGFHGIEPMMVLLEEGQITNVQFLLHSEKEIKD